MHLYTSQDINNLEARVSLVNDCDMKNTVIAQIALRRKQLNGNKFLTSN